MPPGWLTCSMNYPCRSSYPAQDSFSLDQSLRGRLGAPCRLPPLPSPAMIRATVAAALLCASLTQAFVAPTLPGAAMRTARKAPVSGAP
jgi:hypothetical protein